MYIPRYKTSPGFAHSFLVVLLAGSAVAALAVAGHSTVLTKKYLAAHAIREQATIDAYSCITFVARTYVSNEGAYLAESLPLTLYHPDRTLCSISSVTYFPTAITLLITVQQHIHPRILQVTIPIQDKKELAIPSMSFLDE